MLTERTTIWAVGATMIYMMNRKNPDAPIESAPKYRTNALADMEPQLNENAVAVYSQELRELLRQCTRY